MALEVYDGTNPTTAEAQVSVAKCEAFALKYYGSNLTASEAAKEATLRRVNAAAMAFPWKTKPLFGLAQTVPFPREGYDGVPWQVEHALHMLARTEHQNIGALSPAGTITGARKRVKIDTIEVEYQPPEEARADAGKTVVSDAMRLLQPFLKVGALEDMGLVETRQTWGIAAV
jgi:hypothetical protein